MHIRWHAEQKQQDHSPCQKLYHAPSMNINATATTLNRHHAVENTKLSPRQKTHHNVGMIASPSCSISTLSEIKIQPTDGSGILKKEAKSETRRLRKVRFHHENKPTTEVSVQVQPIDMIKSERVKSRLWYTARDIATMLSHDLVILSLMDIGYTDETLWNNEKNATLLKSKYSKKELEELTTRGLERQTKKGITKFRAVSRASIEAVLNCQYQNRTKPVPTRMERIAAIYAVTTNESRQSSLRRAKQDANFVLEHCHLQQCTTEMLLQHHQQQQQQQQQRNHKLNHRKAILTTTTSLFSLFHRPTHSVITGQ